MAKKRSPQPDSNPGEQPFAATPRIARPLSLLAQVEQILREAINQGKFPGHRLPTEMELAEQLGVSRETVRRAAETLQREGLLVKYRRKGTFTRPPALTLSADNRAGTVLGYLQADYETQAQDEAATRTISGLMLQGALAEAGRAGLELMVRHALPAHMGEAVRQLQEGARLLGIIFASYGEDKLLRRVSGLGLPTVLLDHDLHLPQVSSVRDDSLEGARQAVQYLAGLGHRRIAFAFWHRTDLNPWRLTGYRQGLRDANLPRRRQWELLSELNETGARQMIAAWEQLSPRPTALLCFNNSLARLVIAELHRRGWAVPETVSVVGCGGEEVPGLTCQRVDWFAMGQRAVQILLQPTREGGKAAPTHQLFPHTLCPGQTTAGPGGV